VKDDHVETLAKQEVLGLAAAALDGDVATAGAERVVESIGVLGENQDPHTVRVTAGARQRLRLPLARKLFPNS